MWTRIKIQEWLAERLHKEGIWSVEESASLAESMAEWYAPGDRCWCVHRWMELDPQPRTRYVVARSMDVLGVHQDYDPKKADAVVRALNELDNKITT